MAINAIPKLAHLQIKYIYTLVNRYMVLSLAKSFMHLPSRATCQYSPNLVKVSDCSWCVSLWIVFTWHQKYSGKEKAQSSNWKPAYIEEPAAKGDPMGWDPGTHMRWWHSYNYTKKAKINTLMNPKGSRTSSTMTKIQRSSHAQDS